MARRHRWLSATGMTRVETENPDCLQTRDWRRSMIFRFFCFFFTYPRHLSLSSGPDSRLPVQNGGTATRRPHAGYCPLCHRNKKSPNPGERVRAQREQRHGFTRTGGPHQQHMGARIRIRDPKFLHLLGAILRPLIAQIKNTLGRVLLNAFAAPIRRALDHVQRRVDPAQVMRHAHRQTLPLLMKPKVQSDRCQQKREPETGQRDGAECETDLNLRIVAWIRQPCADAFRERARIQRDAVLRKFLPLRSAVGGHVQRGMKRVRGSMRWRGSSARTGGFPTLFAGLPSDRHSPNSAQCASKPRPPSIDRWFSATLFSHSQIGSGGFERRLPVSVRFA